MSQDTAPGCVLGSLNLDGALFYGNRNDTEPIAIEGQRARFMDAVAKEMADGTFRPHVSAKDAA